MKEKTYDSSPPMGDSLKPGRHVEWFVLLRCISLAGYIVQHACSAAAACSTCHELTRWKYVLKHVRACKLQNVIKTLSQYMQLARLCLCASSAVACAVFTNRMRTWNRKLMIHVNKPRLNRSTSCIHHRYGTSDFFFLRCATSWNIIPNFPEWEKYFLVSSTYM